MVCLKRIEFYILHMPLAHEMKLSFASYKERSVVVIRLYDQDECYGLGEASPLQDGLYKPEFNEGVILAIQHIFWPLLKDKHFQTIHEIDHLLEKICGHYFAKSALSLAFCDLFARKNNQNILDFLGILPKAVSFSKTLFLAHDLGVLKDEAQKAWDEGIRLLKLKIKPGLDFLPTAFLREHFPKSSLMVDANASYTLEERHALHKFQSLDVLCIEQPFHGTDFVYHALFQEESGIPVALDESIDHLHHAFQAVSLKSATMLNIKIGRVGGMSVALKMAALSSKNWVGGLLEGPVGLCANLALCQSPLFSFPADFMDFMSLMPCVLSYFSEQFITLHKNEVTTRFTEPGLTGSVNVHQLLADAHYVGITGA